MKTYIVEYFEDDDGGVEGEVVSSQFFICDADDIQHAKEQCENAYPNCEVVAVYLEVKVYGEEDDGS